MIKKIFKRINIFKIFNAIARIFLEFLIAFVWIRYFVQEFIISLISSILAAIIIEILLVLFKKRKENKHSSTKETEEKINSISQSFLFSDDKENIDFFYKLAKEKHQAKKMSKYILINNPNSTVALIPFFTYNPFSCDNLIYCYNLVKPTQPTKIVICANLIDQNAIKLIKNFQNVNIVILDKRETYFKLLVPYNIFPNIKKFSPPSKPTAKDLLAYSLNKKRSKGYFFASIILLISSFMVRNNIYYVIMSSLLLVLSLISFSNPKFNKKTPEHPLD